MLLWGISLSYAGLIIAWIDYSVMTAHLQYSFLSSLVEQLFSVGQVGVHVRGAAASEPGMGTRTPITVATWPCLQEEGALLVVFNTRGTSIVEP